MTPSPLGKLMLKFTTHPTDNTGINQRRSLYRFPLG
jgi:hypothetical protein